MTFGGKTHRMRRYLEADPQSCRVRPQRGPCWARPCTSPVLPRQRTHDASRHQVDTLLEMPEIPRSTPSGSVSGGSPGPLPQERRRASLPSLDMSSEALLLARQLHMDFQEVKSIMQELRDVPHLRNGGIALEHFGPLLRRLFGVQVSQHVLEEAYADCATAEGPIDARRFITWYRDHIFQMEARKMEKVEEDLTLELAKRHQCSPMDLEHVKCKFDSFDLDKSGIIDHDEFEQMIYSLLHCSSSADLPRNRLQRFWVEADQDRDGALDFEEFTEWYMKYFASANQQGLMEAFYASYLPKIHHCGSSTSTCTS